MDSFNTMLLCCSLEALDDMEEKYQETKKVLDEMEDEMSSMS